MHVFIVQKSEILNRERAGMIASLVRHDDDDVESQPGVKGDTSTARE